MTAASLLISQWDIGNLLVLPSVGTMLRFGYTAF